MSEIIELRGQVPGVTRPDELLNLCSRLCREQNFVSRHLTFISAPVLPAGITGSLLAALGHFKPLNRDSLTKSIIVVSKNACLTIEADASGGLAVRARKELIGSKEELRDLVKSEVGGITIEWNGSQSDICTYEENLNLCSRPAKDPILENSYSKLPPAERKRIYHYPSLSQVIQPTKKITPEKWQALLLAEGGSLPRVENLRCDCRTATTEYDIYPSQVAFSSWENKEGKCPTCGKEVQITKSYLLPEEVYRNLVGEGGHFLQFWVADAICDYRRWNAEELLLLSEEVAEKKENLVTREACFGSLEELVKTHNSRGKIGLTFDVAQCDLMSLKELQSKYSQDRELNSILQPYIEDMESAISLSQNTNSLDSLWDELEDIYKRGKHQEQSDYDGLLPTLQRHIGELKREITKLKATAEFIRVAWMPEKLWLGCKWERFGSRSAELDVIALLANSPVYFSCKKIASRDSRADIINIFTTLERIGFAKGYFVCTGYKEDSAREGPPLARRGAIEENESGSLLIGLCDSLSIGFIVGASYHEIRRDLVRNILETAAETCFSTLKIPGEEGKEPTMATTVLQQEDLIEFVMERFDRRS